MQSNIWSVDTTMRSINIKITLLAHQKCGLFSEGTGMQ